MYGGFPVEQLFGFVAGSLFGAGKPFFVPSPAKLPFPRRPPHSISRSPAMAKLSCASSHSISRAWGMGSGAAADRAFSCSAAHSMEPTAHNPYGLRVAACGAARECRCAPSRSSPQAVVAGAIGDRLMSQLQRIGGQDRRRRCGIAVSRQDVENDVGGMDGVGEGFGAGLPPDMTLPTDYIRRSDSRVPSCGLLNLLKGFKVTRGIPSTARFKLRQR